MQHVLRITSVDYFEEASVEVCYEVFTRWSAHSPQGGMFRWTLRAFLVPLPNLLWSVTLWGCSWDTTQHVLEWMTVKLDDIICSFSRTFSGLREDLKMKLSSCVQSRRILRSGTIWPQKCSTHTSIHRWLFFCRARIYLGNRRIDGSLVFTFILIAQYESLNLGD